MLDAPLWDRHVAKEWPGVARPPKIFTGHPDGHPTILLKYPRLK